MSSSRLNKAACDGEAGAQGGVFRVGNNHTTSGVTKRGGPRCDASRAFSRTQWSTAASVCGRRVASRGTVGQPACAERWRRGTSRRRAPSRKARTFVQRKRGIPDTAGPSECVCTHCKAAGRAPVARPASTALRKSRKELEHSCSEPAGPAISRFHRLLQCALIPCLRHRKRVALHLQAARS